MKILFASFLLVFAIPLFVFAQTEESTKKTTEELEAIPLPEEERELMTLEELGFLHNTKLQKVLNQTYTLQYSQQKTNFPLGDFVQNENLILPKEGYRAEIENIYHCPIEAELGIFCENSQVWQEKTRLHKGAIVSLWTDKIKLFLNGLSENFQTAAKDGRLEMDANGQLSVLVPSQAGYTLDSEASYENIASFIKEKKAGSTINLAVEFVQPKVPTTEPTSLGVNQLIATGTSSFVGSPKNRIHNIETAIKRFHGLILAPKEEFSFVENLGAVDASTGYKAELVIKKNKTIPEFGGGICQVSTTMFRAAVNAGMEITARRNHAYPVQYYSPQGTDATVYIPKPDFKFINNTPQYLLIQARIEDKKLSFDFYGTSDGRQVETKGPVVTSRTHDGGMRTSYTQIVKDKDGNIIREDTFRSFYDNPAKYH